MSTLHLPQIAQPHPAHLASKATSRPVANLKEEAEESPMHIQGRAEHRTHTQQKQARGPNTHCTQVRPPSLGLALVTICLCSAQERTRITSNLIGNAAQT